MEVDPGFSMKVFSMKLSADFAVAERSRLLFVIGGVVTGPPDFDDLDVYFEDISKPGDVIVVKSGQPTNQLHSSPT